MPAPNNYTGERWDAPGAFGPGHMRRTEDPLEVAAQFVLDQMPDEVLSFEGWEVQQDRVAREIAQTVHKEGWEFPRRYEAWVEGGEEALKELDKKIAVRLPDALIRLTPYALSAQALVNFREKLALQQAPYRAADILAHGQPTSYLAPIVHIRTPGGMQDLKLHRRKRLSA